VRRFGRILLNTTAILSTALFVGFLALWIVGPEVYVGSNPQFWVRSRYGVLDAGIGRRFVSIPFVIPLLITALAPVHWLHGWFAERERRRGAEPLWSLCTRCGYDLRATPGRCPECGAVPGPAGSPEGPPGATHA
jgi:hypothetical protein